ncbi:integrase core domain-containing protein [Lentzea sokolovensis]|uniref:integrase core domain-containing protein n=1 Tax=Lentzea sokolovensis TaxID=3095429 RepID=UPI003873091E
MNAHCERIIGSIRREVLDHVLIMREGHACQVLAACQAHYNGHRPHQARAQRPPDMQEPPHRRMISMAVAAGHFVRGCSVK